MSTEQKQDWEVKQYILSGAHITTPLGNGEVQTTRIALSKLKNGSVTGDHIIVIEAEPTLKLMAEMAEALDDVLSVDPNDQDRIKYNPLVIKFHEFMEALK